MKREAMIRWAPPFVLAVVLGGLLGVLLAPPWIGFLALAPLVFFGCWWTLIRHVPREPPS